MTNQVNLFLWHFIQLERGYTGKIIDFASFLAMFLDLVPFCLFGLESVSFFKFEDGKTRTMLIQKAIKVSSMLVKKLQLECEFCS